MPFFRTVTWVISSMSACSASQMVRMASLFRWSDWLSSSLSCSKVLMLTASPASISRAGTIMRPLSRRVSSQKTSSYRGSVSMASSRVQTVSESGCVR